MSAKVERHVSTVTRRDGLTGGHRRTTDVLLQTCKIVPKTREGEGSDTGKGTKTKLEWRTRSDDFMNWEIGFMVLTGPFKCPLKVLTNLKKRLKKEKSVKGYIRRVYTSVTGLGRRHTCIRWRELINIRTVKCELNSLGLKIDHQSYYETCPLCKFSTTQLLIFLSTWRSP